MKNFYNIIQKACSNCIICHEDNGLVCEDCNTMFIHYNQKFFQENYRLYVPYYYKYPVDSLILKFKYSNKYYLADYFAEIIANKFTPENDGILIPIPISSWKLLKRGYNQAFLLAKSLGYYWNMKVEPLVLSTNNVFYNIGATKIQRTLRTSGMSLNDISPIIGKNVFLVDDVVASGETIKKAINLIEPYCNNISIVSIAKT